MRFCSEGKMSAAQEWTVIPMLEILEMLRDVLRGEDNDDDNTAQQLPQATARN